MTSDELKTFCRVNLGIRRPILGSERTRSFDPDWDEAPLEWIKKEARKAVVKRREKGLSWKKNGSDCDNWALWVQSDVTEAYAVKNKDRQHNSVLFGFAQGKTDKNETHAFNLAITGGEAYVFNYGELIDHTGWKFNEVTFV